MLEEPSLSVITGLSLALAMCMSPFRWPHPPSQSFCSRRTHTPADNLTRCIIVSIPVECGFIASYIWCISFIRCTFVYHLHSKAHVWQSWVEIEHYSEAYFDCVTAFEVLCRCTNTRHIYAVRMSPALNVSSALQHFKRGNAIEIRNGIMFDFYLGLPHTLINMC